MPAPRHISPAKAAERFDVSTYTVARLCDEGELVDLLVRGQVRVTIDSIEQYEKRQIESRKRDRRRLSVDPSAGRGRRRRPIDPDGALSLKGRSADG